MLTPQQLKEREGKLTASSVACLMTGDKKKMLHLWRELVGDPEYEPFDFSRIWPVQLGSVTEELNLDWYEQKTGSPVTRRGEVVISKRADWAACTLDGWDEAKGFPIECKHVGGRESLATVLARYQPQFHWQMIVTESNCVVASIIEGANEPLLEKIELQVDYAEELWRRAEKFMWHVNTLTPPVSIAPVAPPLPATVAYDFTGKNEWADKAVTWLENAPKAKLAETASDALKAMVPEDAQKVHGHGVVITRDRARRLSLREAKE